MIGVDPGLDGAITVVKESDITAYVMPTFKQPSGRGRAIDTRRIVEIIEMAMLTPSKWYHVFINAQRPMPRHGVRSMFTAGKRVGVTEGVCPASILKAGRLCPNVSLLATDRCFEPHDGLADALLIATYGKHVLMGRGVKSRSRENSG